MNFYSLLLWLLYCLFKNCKCAYSLWNFLLQDAFLTDLNCIRWFDMLLVIKSIPSAIFLENSCLSSPASTHLRVFLCLCGCMLVLTTEVLVLCAGAFPPENDPSPYLLVMNTLWNRQVQKWYTIVYQMCWEATIGEGFWLLGLLVGFLKTNDLHLLTSNIQSGPLVLRDWAVILSTLPWN